MRDRRAGVRVRKLKPGECSLNVWPAILYLLWSAGCYSLSIRSVVSPGLAASTQPGASKPPDRFHRRLTIGFCLVALVLGAFEAWMSRFEMSPDDIQYLDNASAYRQGDFRDALNAQWSPLYPSLIARAEAIVRPLHEEKFGLAHAINFSVFAASIVCFLFFLKSMPRAASTTFLLLNYAAFLYCSLDFTHLF